MTTIGLIKYCRRIILGLLLVCIPLNSAYAVIRIGAIFFDPPLVLSASQGFNIALSNRLCQGIGQQCEIVQMDWRKLFPALDNNEIDVIMGVYITPARQQHYIFSLPYMLSQGRFMTLTDNKLTSVAQLKGQSVGLLTEEAGTGVFHQYVQQAYGNFFQVSDYNDIEDLLSALMNKSVTAIIIPDPVTNYWIQNSDNRFATLGPVFTLGLGSGIMALPQNQPLIDSINQELKNMENNGDYLSIYRMYFQ